MKKIIRWDTCLSDVRDLYFKSLSDDGTLNVLFTDSEDNIYEITAEKISYKLSEEELLTDHWNLIKSETGRTFIIENSKWLTNDYVTAGFEYTHYVITSWDLCIEILACDDDVIVKHRIN